MDEGLGVERILGEVALIPLDELYVLRGSVYDAGPFLEADSAAAGGAALDLGQLGLIYKGTAVAVAAIGLGGLFG